MNLLMRLRLKIPALILIPVGIYAIGFLALFLWKTVTASPGTGLPPSGPPASVFVDKFPQLVGKPAPDFVLTGTDGKTHRLKDYPGKLVVLNFWATWCAPCRLETPLLQKTYARLQTGEFVVLGVDQAEDIAPVNSFVKEFNLTYPILLDTDLAATQAYGVIGLPTTFFVDPKGIVQAKQIGMLTEGSLQQYLDQFMASSGDKATASR
jgi:peroxiredoxin